MTGRDGEVAQAPAAPTVEKPGLRKLKPGPGLSRQAVAKNQKLRLQAALSDLVAESGYDAVTVRALTRRANVSTSTFYKHYESVEGCLVGIIGMTIRSVATEVRQSQELDGDVIAGLRKALRSLMDRLAQEPQRAQTVFIESSAAGPRVRDETDAALGELEALLVHTFAVAPRPAAGTKHLAVGLVAGVVGIIRRTTLAGRVDELPGLAGDLTDWMLSVADEEVVTFLRQRSRSVDGNVGDRLQRLGVGSATRESVTGGVNRAIATAARLAATNGLAGLSSAKIRKDAGLSRSEFDQHFASVDDCFLAAVESVSASAATTAQLYAADAGSWERWVCRVMTAISSLAAGDQALTRLVLVDITAPGRTGLLRREELIGRLAAHVRDQARPGKPPSEIGAVASVSAIWRIAEREVAARRTAQLPRIAPIFVYIILAARRPQGVPDRCTRPNWTSAPVARQPLHTSRSPDPRD